VLPTTDCRPRAAGNTKYGYSAKRAIPVMPGQGLAKGNSLHAKRKNAPKLPGKIFVFCNIKFPDRASLH
jgi:hypothetical protein